MTKPHSLVKRLLLAGGLALGVLATAALGGSAAGADPPPGAGPLTLPAPTTPVGPLPAPLTLDRFAITEVGGTAATLDVAASAPSIFSYTIRRVDGRVHDDRSGTAGLPTTGYQREYRVRLLNLDSNTTYEVAVAATNGDGQTTATKRFTTSKQRIRVTLREIDIKEDGDLFGKGEPSWAVSLTWAGGSASGCFPSNGGECTFGSYHSGVIFPRNRAGQSLTWLFAEENFDKLPDKLTLGADANENDPSDVVSWVANCLLPGPGCHVGDNDETDRSWQNPRDQEWSSTPVKMIAYDEETGFRSILTLTIETFHDNLSYPAPRRNLPSSTWG